MAEIVALTQLLLEMDIFVHQALLVGFDYVVDLDRLRNHRGNDREELRRAFIITISLVLNVRSQRPDRLVIQQHGNTDKGEFLPAHNFLSDAQPIEKHRFTAHLRHDDRFARLHHASRNALSQFVPYAARTIFIQTVRSHNSFQLERTGQRHAGVQKCLQLTRLYLGCAHLRKTRSVAFEKPRSPTNVTKNSSCDNSMA